MSHKKRIIDSAQQYLAYGWNPIALRSKEKRPVIKEWQKHVLKPEDVEKHFQEESPNIGILLGDSSGNLIDIDLDCQEACALAPYILPKTNAIFGRESKPASHYLYICDDTVETSKFNDREHGMLVELRSTGAQTMFPPSVHPSGEQLFWRADVELPSAVSSEQLHASVTLLAISALLVKSYPAAGSRNEFALSLAGGLLRIGKWTVAEIEKAIGGIAQTAQDEEWFERIKVVAATKEKLDADLPIKGMQSLKEIIGEAVASQIYKWCQKISSTEATVSNLLEQMNQEYALVIIGGKSVVAKIRKEGEATELDFLSTTAFRDYFSNTCTQHNGRYVTNAEYWLKHPRRRTYDGIVFEPDKETPKYFNFWQGFVVEATEGDCSLFLKHTREVICAGNDELYEYVLGWLAAIIQKPRLKVGTALVIRGKQGAGKSLWVKYFSTLIAPYCVMAESPHLITGRFNGHLKSCLLLHAEEGFWAGDKTAESKLKELITGESMTIEMKGKEPFSVQNFIRLLVTGNPNWMIPAAFEERRFVVVEASETHMQEHGYFQQLAEEMQNGGKEALLYFLLHHDYSHINLKVIPKTSALLEQKISSMDAFSAWWLDVLSKGELPYHDAWAEHVAVADLISSYIEHAQRTGERRRAIETEFGRRMKKCVQQLKKSKGSVLCWNRDDQYLQRRSATYYCMPSLQQCRSNFEAMLGQAVGWDDPEIAE